MEFLSSKLKIMRCYGPDVNKTWLRAKVNPLVMTYCCNNYLNL